MERRSRLKRLGIYSEPSRILAPLPPIPGRALPGETWVSRILREFLTEKSVSAKTTHPQVPPAHTSTLPPQAATESKGEPEAPPTPATDNVSTLPAPSRPIVKVPDRPVVPLKPGSKPPMTRPLRSQNTKSASLSKRSGVPPPHDSSVTQRRLNTQPNQPHARHTRDTPLASQYLQLQEPEEVDPSNDDMGLQLILQAIEVEREVFDGVDFE